MSRFEKIIQTTEKAIYEFESSLKEMADLEEQLAAMEAEIPNVTKKIELYEEVRIVLQDMAKETRTAICSELEHVVTLCLQSVFGEKYSFEIEIDTSRNTTVIDFFVIDGRGPVPIRRPPEDSMGGGIVDTCAIGLRWGLLQIVNPYPVGPILVDEPAKMVSSEDDAVREIGNLLQELTHLIKKQCILVTHHEPIKETIEHAIFVKNVQGSTVISYGREQDQ